MSMTFQQFIDYLTTHLWKIGDSLVVNNLPTIIKTADAELNASFKVEDVTRSWKLRQSAVAFKCHLIFVQ